MSQTTITHPCDSWAKSAGAQSWQDAVSKMKAGAVLAGPAPVGFKTLINMRLFILEVEREGLHLYVDESDRAVLGRRESFSQDILDLEAREIRRVAQRMGMMLG